MDGERSGNGRPRGPAWVGVMLLGWTALAAAQDTPGALQVQLAYGRETSAVPAWERHGELFVPLRPVVEFFGGTLGWAPAPHKAVLQGPEGRRVLLSPGNPRAVLDGKRLVRLPEVARLRSGQIWVTPESFRVLWDGLGVTTPVYHAETRTLRLNEKAGVPAPAAVRTDPDASGPKAAALGAGLRCVVVDAGHGGKDPGAIGPSRLQEKDVTLAVALALADRLERELRAKIILTRRDDRFIPLSERPEIANQAKADLFISIHANASRNDKASGSQVFIYNREASSQKAAETARLENRDANYLEIIKDDLRQSVHQVDSITVAGLVSQELEREGQEARRIERAPFFVLAKSHMPSILVETAFISNREEEGKLRRQEFGRRIADAIVRGVRQYEQEKSRVAQD